MVSMNSLTMERRVSFWEVSFGLALICFTVAMRVLVEFCKWEELIKISFLSSDRNSLTMERRVSFWEVSFGLALICFTVAMRVLVEFCKWEELIKISFLS